MTLSQPFVFATLPRKLPQGYGAAPLTEGELGAVVRLCAIVKGTPKGGEPVVLRETLDARVCLGALVDRMGAVHQWVELWSQDLTGLGRALPGYRDAVTNSMLDRRWADRAHELTKSEGGLVVTGWEMANPPPLFVDAKKMVPVASRDRRTGGTWSLCKDEALLAKKGVPGYGGSASRHLYQPEMGEETPLLPLDVVGADPEAMGLGPAGEVVAINGGGGLMMVRPYAPLSYEQYVDALTGVEGEGGAADALLGAISSAATGSSAPGRAGGWLNLSAAGTPARLVEALHLKLMLLAGAVAAVRSTTAATQTPMLNVTARSFRVRLGGGTALPLWWTAQAELVEPGEGVELPIEGTTARYYLAPTAGAVSVYTPAARGRSASGAGWLRLRNIVSESNGAILEGTLSTQDRVSPGSHDLLWLRMSVGSTRVDLYGVIDSKEAMASGELRVRTIPQQLPGDVTERLKAAMGVPIPDVKFELVPLLSTPCDLYALGVLAVRTLLTGPGRGLPVALDELMSLAAQAGQNASSGEALVDRVARVFESDPKWAASLGPQRLLAGVEDADEAFLAVPSRLWFGTLAMMIRMFTGMTADSRCRDLGDAPTGGVHRVFDGVLDDLYSLLTAARSLIVSDQGLSADVREVVQECLGLARR